MALQLKHGMAVEVHRLRKRGELNGQTGNLRNYDNESQRWEVNIGHDDLRKIKSENLEPRVHVCCPQGKMCRYGSPCHRSESWFTR